MGATRRAVLIAGGAAVVVAGAWALTRAPKKAREPWRKAAAGFGDPRLDALAYAILAPNPHNMQPWKIALDGDDGFRLYADLTRMLPETDPPNRQITIGFGCFLELFRQAAAEKGFRADLAYFPEGEPEPLLDGRPVAAVRMIEDPNVARDPLFGGALERRTNRAPFKDQPVGEAALKTTIAAGVPGVLAEATNDATRVAALRDLTIEAWRIEWGLARTRRESIAVTRIGKREIEAEPFGLALSGPLVEGIAAAGVLTRESMDAPTSPGFRQSLDFYERACESAQAFVWAKTAANTRRDQLDSGRAWMRMHLAAAAAGLAVHPLSQALQEFPEMAAPYARAHELLAPAGGTVQMLARLGYTQSPPPSPREPLDAKLLPLS
jgi:nitroreductase